MSGRATAGSRWRPGRRDQGQVAGLDRGVGAGADAMPRSACARAAASLTPSPTMATAVPLACRSATTRALPSGRTPPKTRPVRQCPALSATAGAQSRGCPRSAGLVKGRGRVKAGRQQRRCRAGWRRRRSARPGPARPGRPAPAVRPCASAAATASRRMPGTATQAGQERLVPQGDGMAAGGARTPAPGWWQSPSPGAAPPGGPHRRGRSPARRVLGGVLDGAGQLEDLVLVGAGRKGDVLERHDPGRRRAGLVEDHGADPAGGLQGLGAADQHPARRRGRSRPAARPGWPGPARTGRR